jgi:hypothetical protein
MNTQTNLPGHPPATITRTDMTEETKPFAPNGVHAWLRVLGPNEGIEPDGAVLRDGSA